MNEHTTELEEGIDRELDAFARTLLLHPFGLHQLKKIAVESMVGFLKSLDLVKKVKGKLPSIFDTNEDAISALEYKKRLEGWTGYEEIDLG